MTKRGEKKFLEVLAGMGELFKRNISTALFGIYLDAMAPYGDEEVLQAIRKCSVTLKFFPAPADIIEAMGGGEDVKALEAWGSLMDAARRVGRYGKVEFEDGRVADMVRAMGGWDAVCDWRTNDLDFRRQEFIKSYRAMGPGRSPAVVSGVLSRGNPVRVALENSKPEKQALPAPGNAV